MKNRKNIVVLTGAGISAESGIKTFRDSDGLWENHRVEDVATYEAWQRNPKLVNDFYNARRKQLLEVEPNQGHKELVRLEEFFNVNIVTQNVDDLHERAGSNNVLHLHGELKKVRSEIDPDYIIELDGWELTPGMKDSYGKPLRPYIVWFGEAVPMIEPAIALCEKADYLIIIGTSLNVYPAAGLMHYAPKNCKKYLVDPKEIKVDKDIIAFHEGAGTGVKKVVDNIISSIK